MRASIRRGIRCGAGGRPTRSALSLESDAAAVAFDVHLEDGGVVDEPVDRGERHGGGRGDLAPFSKGLIGRDQDGTTLVAGARSSFILSRLLAVTSNL